jgi:hypothetical protein
MEAQSVQGLKKGYVLTRHFPDNSRTSWLRRRRTLRPFRLLHHGCSDSPSCSPAHNLRRAQHDSGPSVYRDLNTRTM